MRRIIVVGLVAVAAACSGKGDPAPTAKVQDAVDATPADAAPVTLDAAPVAVDPPAPTVSEHAVWHLAPNREMAHRIVDGDLVVDAGAPGFARYTRFGLPKKHWKLGNVAGGQPTAQAGGGASLDLPLTAEQAKAARVLVVRVHAAGEGSMTVKVQGRKMPRGKVELEPGWQTVAIPAAGRWIAGENFVVIEGSTRLNVRWLQVAHDAAAATAPDPLTRAGWDSALGALKVGEASGLVWYVEVPVGATLVTDVVGDCKAEVSARDGDGSFVGGLLTGDGARLDLAKLAGKVARLEITGRDCAAGGVLRDARIVLAGPDAPPPPAGKPPKYVVFWVMDATRADKIPTFTPGARAETPNFDRLAKTGAVFRQHYVGGNESQVSHTSMFTSLYPKVHTVRGAGNQINFLIPKKFPIMGKLMKAAGYNPIGVTANGFVTEGGGYARGFSVYRNMMQERHQRNGRIFGAEVIDDVIRRLAKQAKLDQPTFLFMGTIDNHSPWIARQPWMDRYDPGPYDGPFQTAGVAGPLGLMRGKMGCHKVPPQRDIERLRAIYDSAISYQDALIGDLTTALDKLGIADETMIIITADHGEELFEERRCGHGASLRDSLARVPLLIHYPAGVSPRIVEEGSEGIDILPTILDAIGAKAPASLQGHSLRPLAAGDGAGWAQPSFASQYEYAFAVRLGRWKARVDKRGRPLVHDMVADPVERKDLSRTRPFERRYLTDHLALYLQHRGRWQKATWGVVSNMTELAAQALGQPP